MKCKKCGEDLSKPGKIFIDAEQAAHDGRVLDIIVECSECGAQTSSYSVMMSIRKDSEDERTQGE